MSGVEYQSVYQGVAASRLIASVAIWGLSPSAVPEGPNAATLAGVSTRAATGVGEGEGEGDGVAGGVLEVVSTAAGWDWTGRGVVTAAWCRSWPTPAANL